MTMCLSTLINLAEDVLIEKKMKRRGIIPHLMKLLQRENLKLLETTFLFLKKLSIFAENKLEMIELDLINSL